VLEFVSGSWVPTALSVSKIGWSVDGNALTSPDSNFVGTTDNADLEFRIRGVFSGLLDSAYQETYFGYRAGAAAVHSGTLALYNTGIGYDALYSNDHTQYNIAIGTNALYSQSYTLGGVLPTYNVAIGYNALYSTVPTAIISGTGNVGVGAYSLSANTIGTGNIAIGAYASKSGTSANYTVAIGDAALQNNNANYNVGVGGYALQFTTTGSGNQAIGCLALNANTIGANNVAIGSNSLQSSVGASNNVAIGYQTLFGSVTQVNNIAIGSHAAYELKAGGGNNVAVGHQAMAMATTGVYNTAVGEGALFTDSLSGTGNTCLGASADQAIGAGNFTNSTALGYMATITQSNNIVLGNSSITAIRGQVQSIMALSDRRFKSDIQENVPGLEFITKLRPVTYRFEARKYEHFVGRPDSLIEKIKEAYDKAEQVVHSGFIAQEVEKTATEINYNFSGLHKPENDGDTYALGYADFVTPLVKSVQELNAKSVSQQQIIETLMQRMEQMQKELDALKNK
jgi:hypothetical protein